MALDHGDLIVVVNFQVGGYVAQLRVDSFCPDVRGPADARQHCTAGIISLLTHICICVVLNILVHAQLTYGHQSPCH